MIPEKNKSIDINGIYKLYEQTIPYLKVGKIISSKGLTYRIRLPKAVIGSNVEFKTEYGSSSYGEVVSIDGDYCLVMPYEEISGINTVTKVFLRGLTTTIDLSYSMLGRVLDFQGKPIDDKGKLGKPEEIRGIFGKVINPLHREPITKLLDVGINTINAFTPIGRGQRMAIMAGSGIGKSVLLGMIAKNTNADINVIALVGERGREVLEFIQNELGPEGLKKSVLIVATSNTSPLIRMKAAYTATTIAEFFKDQGKDVLLMMDSLTRFAMANREIALNIGEPPGQKGYSPSVFARLPKLMERAGNFKNGGSITGIYTILVEGDDMDEPITDAVRAISDGHIQMSRDLAAQNHFPAIDVLPSISRVMNNIVSKEHKIIASHLRNLLAAYRENEDLINLGAYAVGTNERVDKAIFIYNDLMELLKQDKDFSEILKPDSLYDHMVELAKKAEKSVSNEEET